MCRPDHLVSVLAQSRADHRETYAPLLFALLTSPGWEGWLCKAPGTPQSMGEESGLQCVCPKRLGMCTHGDQWQVVLVNLVLGCTQGMYPYPSGPAQLQSSTGVDKTEEGECPTVALPASWLSGYAETWAGCPAPAAWRERGNRTITWITGSSLPSASWGSTESELLGED